LREEEFSETKTKVQEIEDILREEEFSEAEETSKLKGGKVS
jgi:hypothetical protein